MELRRTSTLLACALTACAALTLATAPPALAADSSAPRPHPHVTARPPLQVIPASPAGASSVQQRMRQCNGQADSRRLRDAARETFIKNCMTAHAPASKPASNTAREAKHRP